MVTDDAVVAKDLRKRYGSEQALAGVDLTVPAGTVFGLLGPNGAGKTTTVRILTTLLRLDGGSATVAGHDVATEGQAVRRRIGLVGQTAAVDEILSGRQNLEMFARLHHLGARAARTRADELLERFDLTGTGGKPVGRYSGGMRRRLDLAAGMVLDPAVLFLDEPTTGLDPRGRGTVWEAVRSLVDGGTTVVLTTQYLEEADQLADRISVIDQGTVIAEGTPDELKSRIGGDRVDVVLPAGTDLAPVATLLHRATGEESDVDSEGSRVSVQVREPAAGLTEVVRALHEAGIAAHDITLRRPTLDDVFLTLTEPADEPATEKKVAV